MTSFENSPTIIRSPAEKKVTVSFFPAARPTDTAEELGEVTKGQPGGC